MAIFHLSVKIISRSKNQSIIAKVAYRAGEKLQDDETAKIYDYTHKKEVVFSEILLCENAPKEYLEKKILWSAVQKIEKQSNAQLAREIEVALPKEFDFETQKKVLREYIKKNFIDVGMIADYSIHSKENNPHAHILLTTRKIKQNGEWDVKERKQYKLDANGEKIPILNADGTQKLGARNTKLWERETVQMNDWNNREKVEEWRKNWAEICNQFLTQENKIDHRSYARQGIDKIPQMKIGVAQIAMKKRGINLIFDKIAINQAIKALWQRTKENVNELRAKLLAIRRKHGKSGVDNGKSERIVIKSGQGDSGVDFEAIRKQLADNAATSTKSIVDAESATNERENRDDERKRLTTEKIAGVKQENADDIGKNTKRQKRITGIER